MSLPPSHPYPSRSRSLWGSYLARPQSRVSIDTNTYHKEELNIPVGCIHLQLLITPCQVLFLWLLILDKLHMVK